MVNYKAILELAPFAQSVGVLGENVKLAKKKKMKLTDPIETGVKTLIGIEFIKAESDIIKGI